MLMLLAPFALESCAFGAEYSVIYIDNSVLVLNLISGLILFVGVFLYQVSIYSTVYIHSYHLKIYIHVRFLLFYLPITDVSTM